jgi:hypothetical protein
MDETAEDAAALAARVNAPATAATSRGSRSRSATRSTRASLGCRFRARLIERADLLRRPERLERLGEIVECEHPRTRRVRQRSARPARALMRRARSTPRRSRASIPTTSRRDPARAAHGDRGPAAPTGH